MLELLLKRRSIRRYERQPVKEEALRQILQAALLAPSGRNKMPWEFIVVQQQETLQALGGCRHPEQTFLPQAPAAVVVLGDTTATDVWVEDCSIAMTMMQLEAERLGLGSCWVQIRKRMAQGETETSDAFVKKLLQIPDPYDVLAILALGYPAEEKAPKKLEQLPYDKIHQEQF